MDLAPDLAIPRVRCAPFAAAQGVDPVGSATAYDVVVLVEVPLPWPHDVSEHPVGQAAAAAPPGRRLMFVVPEAADAPEAGARVIRWSRRPGRPSYQRSAWWVPPHELGASVAAVVAAPAEGDPLPHLRHHEAVTGELLVCTHGRRDQCCGSLGAALHQELASGWPLPGTSLRRVSHTGGHRYAPTALSFPDGHAWAFLTAEVARAVAARSGEPAAVAPHCRGSLAVDGGPAQAALREALVAEGWGLLDAEVRTEVVRFERDTLLTVVRTQLRRPDGSTGELLTEVEPARWVPQPTCGVAPGPEFGVYPEWRVRSSRSAARTP